MKYYSSKILIIILGILVLASLLAFYLLFNASNHENSNQSNNKGVDVDLQSKVLEKQFGIPLHVSTPKINVEADIEPAGLAKDGTLAVPKGSDGVTWYKDGAKPGEMGSAVITGHYGPWLSGANSVFDNLNNLEKGDKIYIKDDKGNILTFEVREKKTYKLSDTVPEIFIKDDASYLNIITCSGQWLAGQKTFTDRLVVFTDLVD